MSRNEKGEAKKNTKIKRIKQEADTNGHSNLESDNGFSNTVESYQPQQPVSGTLECNPSTEHLSQFNESQPTQILSPESHSTAPEAYYLHVVPEPPCPPMELPSISEASFHSTELPLPNERLVQNHSINHHNADVSQSHEPVIVVAAAAPPPPPPTDEHLEWPNADLCELVDRMEKGLPHKDNLAYSTRAEKLDWANVAFKEYTAEECKKTWLLVQKKVRRFRLLRELLHDAKEYITKPWTTAGKGNKNASKRHPDMPRKPLSVYMIFYLSKKDKIVKDKPGMEMTEVSKIIAQMYKIIPQEERDRYNEYAAEERRKYERNMEEFYRLHPEFLQQQQIEKANSAKPAKRKRPPKPTTPFVLFFEDRVKQTPPDPNIDLHVYKEQCRDEYKNLADNKKLIWIDAALEKETKFWEDLKSYQLDNPGYEPKTNKHILSKEEKLLKQRLAGKPIKPPNSAYGLFSRIMLQSDEIKKVDHKDRMKVVALQWKNCSESDKRNYQEQTNQLLGQYKADYASYLKSLPEDKRQLELQNNASKHKQKEPIKEEKKIEEPPPPPAPIVINPSKRKLRGYEEYRDPQDDLDKQNDENNESENMQPRVNELLHKKIKIEIEIKKEEEIEEPDVPKTIYDLAPKQPPDSAYTLYVSRYTGKQNSSELAWKKLNKMVKQRLDEEVIRLKQQYMKEYNKFLKGLSKDQLLEFMQIKKERDLANLKAKALKKKKSEDESSNSGDYNCYNGSSGEDN